MRCIMTLILAALVATPALSQDTPAAPIKEQKLEEANKALTTKLEERDIKIAELEAKLKEQYDALSKALKDEEAKTKALAAEIAELKKQVAKPMIMVRMPADWRGDHLRAEVLEQDDKIIIKVLNKYREHLQTGLMIGFLPRGGADVKKVLDRPIVVPAATYEDEIMKEYGFDEHRITGTFADLKAVVIDLRDGDDVVTTKTETTEADEPVVVEVKPGNDAWNVLSQDEKRKAHQSGWTYTKEQNKALGGYILIDGKKTKLRPRKIDGERHYEPR